MKNLTRRDMLSGMTMAGAALIAPGGSEPALANPMSAAAPTTEPILTPEARKLAVDKLMKYFTPTCPQLLRPAEGLLKYPSITVSLPGKEYSTQLWDWDSLWTVRGLFRFAKLTNDKAFHQNIAEHSKGSLLNFFDHQSDEGRIPIVVSINEADALGSLGKASPQSKNQAKPVLGQHALMLADELGTVDWLAPVFDNLMHFYESWVLGNESSLGLFVWGTDVGIGNDNDPTTWARPFFSSANVLLNCLFYEDLKAASELAKRLNRPKDHERLARNARELGEAIQKYSWDPRDRFYYTVDVQCVDHRYELLPTLHRGMETSWKSLPLRIQTFTGFLPMWCGLATKEQADLLVHEHYNADDRFRGQWGVRSLSSKETMYSLEFTSNPSNWLGPVWIMANYFVWKGLKDYGFTKEAADLADKTIKLLAKDLDVNGSLNEYYHPDTGAGLSHKGFMDWNLLVLEMV